jgi:hypothetical protein
VRRGHFHLLAAHVEVSARVLAGCTLKIKIPEAPSCLGSGWRKCSSRPDFLVSPKPR